MGILQAFKSALWDVDNTDEIEENMDVQTIQELKKLNKETNLKRIGHLEKLVDEPVVFPDEEKKRNIVNTVDGETLYVQKANKRSDKKNKSKEEKEIAQ